MPLVIGGAVAVVTLVAGVVVTVTSQGALTAALTATDATPLDFYGAQGNLSVGVGLLVAGLVGVVVALAAVALVPAAVRPTADASATTGDAAVAEPVVSETVVAETIVAEPVVTEAPDVEVPSTAEAPAAATGEAEGDSPATQPR
ncbi:hypothetical protein D9V30_03645 [Mycetocola reblochoni]|uniref:Dinucleotide-utilizing enzyme n=2 Tax=Mycetocola reblochoni TaxID=331618 RepID=A0A1R4JY45_9MICO|nr:hypothetical protein D9V30_03645 [Mycetocola reblochoni]SJN36755.1 hypothetical protein FM119_10090 [Mycetocola reblochoni REB411]